MGEQGEFEPQLRNFAEIYHELGLVLNEHLQQLLYETNPAFSKKYRTELLSVFQDEIRLQADAVPGPDHRLLQLGVFLAETEYMYYLDLYESIAESFEDEWEGILYTADIYVQAGLITEELFFKIEDLARSIMYFG